MPTATSPPDVARSGRVNTTWLTPKRQDFWVEGSEVNEILKEEVGAIPGVSRNFVENCDVKGAIRTTGMIRCHCSQRSTRSMPKVLSWSPEGRWAREKTS